jgi:hypothetical protein
LQNTLVPILCRTVLSAPKMLLSNDSYEANGTGSHALVQVEEESGASTNESSIPSHPLGIKPLGNRYLFAGSSARQFIGTFQALPEEILTHLLEYLDQQALRLLGYTCKFLFAHCVSDELWKSLFLE